MTLRNKLLLYFSSLIIFILITYGLSAYQAAYNIAIDKDKKQLEELTNIKSTQYSNNLHKNNSIYEVTSDLKHHSGDKHLNLIIDTTTI